MPLRSVLLAAPASAAQPVSPSPLRCSPPRARRLRQHSASTIFGFCFRSARFEVLPRLIVTYLISRTPGEALRWAAAGSAKKGLSRATGPPAGRQRGPQTKPWAAGRPQARRQGPPGRPAPLQKARQRHGGLPCEDLSMKTDDDPCEGTGGGGPVDAGLKSRSGEWRRRCPRSGWVWKGASVGRSR